MGHVFRNDEQKLAVEGFRRFLDNEIEPIAREYRDRYIPKPKMLDILRELVQYGMITGVVAEEHGGMGGTGCDWQTSTMLYEELVYTSVDIATVVLINPMHRRTFDANGKITNSHGDYPEAVRQAAKEESVAFIDLHANSKLLYEAFGPEQSGVLFKEGDGTHHNAFGADQIAKIIVQWIRDQKLPLAKFLTGDWKRFDPKRPDDSAAFAIPASPAVVAMKPLGS